MQPIGAPLAKRHRFESIGLKSKPKKTNSVAMPWVDMVEDVRMIREGKAERILNDRWRINGRIYVREDTPKGTMFPESGDGIVVLTRGQYKALSIIRGYNTDTVAAENELLNDPNLTEADVLVARDVIRQAAQS